MATRWISKKWIIALVAIFAWIALTCVQNKVAPIATVLMEHFNINMSTAGWLSSIFAVMGMGAAVPAAVILKKIGAKKSGCLALLFALCGSVIGLYTSSVTMLIASRVIEGFGVGIIAVTGPALISMWFPAEKRGLPMGIWGSGMTISQALVFFFVAPVLDNYGWQGMWKAGIFICLIALVLFYWLAKSPPPESNYAQVRGHDVSILEGLKSRSSWFLCLSATCFTFSCFGFATWIAPYWSQVTGWPMSEVFYWISFLYTLEIGLSWVVGGLLNFKVDRKKIAMGSFAIYALCLFLAFTTTSSKFVLVLVFILPLFEAATIITMWTIATQTVQRAALIGVSIAILDIGLNCGIIIGQPVMGWTVENFGWTAGAALLGGVSLMGTFALLFVTIYEDQTKPLKSIL